MLKIERFRKLRITTKKYGGELVNLSKADPKKNALTLKSEILLNY